MRAHIKKYKAEYIILPLVILFHVALLGGLLFTVATAPESETRYLETYEQYSFTAERGSIILRENYVQDVVWYFYDAPQIGIIPKGQSNIIVTSTKQRMLTEAQQYWAEVEFVGSNGIKQTGWMWWGKEYLTAHKKS